MPQDKSGTGSLIIDGKKSFAISHWLTHSSDEAIHEVEIALKDAPFAFGPWGEQLAGMKILFIGSTTNLCSLPECGMTPMAGEASIPINWSLSLTGKAQGYLFQRIRKSFDKATAIVDDVQDKKKYRMNEEDLLMARNTLALWDQIREFCSTRLSNFADLEKGLVEGTGKDHELRQLLDERPATFSVSMLPCAQKEAVATLRKKEETINMEVEKERLKVRDTRWEYFVAALARDQSILRQIDGAPSKIEALRHRKQVAWRMAQSKIGDKVARSYMEKYLRCSIVEKVEHAQQQVNEYRSFVVAQPCILRLSPSS